MQGIDFEKVLEIARLGIRRASLFMGFAVNMANNPNVCEYDLSHQTKYRVLPETNDENMLAEYKHEFRTWVIVNALRELHESFVEYMEKVNQACLTFDWVVGEKTPEECDRLQKKFHKAGFPDKFDILRRQFTVTTQHEHGWLSVNAARNCFTHRRGVVGREDFNEGNHLQLRWRALEIYFIPAGGTPVLNHDIPLDGLPMQGGALESKYVDRSCFFDKGQLVELSPLQLAEICAFADEAAVELANSAVEFARGKGISIGERPSGASDG
ncbi:hypothetical protein H8K52_09750 [Undibacterium seohonense]|uniref:Uncharacterized protein n=1 Tax=Undibacterium seohonense TaxID=1344950 RepID=A0ABR6X4X7_9BURK|nr:hypothetical protein [Undibacterium seohonense]MBC3807625.1 hypothetical protein [Undibacterium seohonense]